MDVRELPIDEIVLDPDLNLRDRLDPEAIERYSESWEDLPPVTVFEVEGRWLLADGFHRHAAFVARNRETIPARVQPGTMADALDHAAGANLAHGLPLRRQERRRVVEVRLRLRPERSDRQLAKEAGVGRELVAKVRGDLVAAGQIPTVGGRLGADGKVYPSQGLPRDPNEHRPRESSPPWDEPEGRGRRDDDDLNGPGRPTPRESPSGLEAPPRRGRADDPRDLARSGPVASASPTIDEMLGMMTQQVMEVVAWIEAEEFAEAYQSAGGHPRSLFQAAVRSLADRAERLLDA